MKIYERLKELVGHEISITTADKEKYSGILGEVKENYVVIYFYDYPEYPLDSLEECVVISGRLYLKPNDIISIYHHNICQGCKTSSAAKIFSGN